MPTGNYTPGDVPYATDDNTIGRTPTTTFGRARMNDADADAARAAIEAAPVDADVLVKTANSELSAERVVTDGTSIVFDWSTPGQVVAKRAALTGDVTAGADSNSTTLANSGVTASIYGDQDNVAQVTFDAKGRATLAANVAIRANAAAATPSFRKLGTGSTDACAGDDARLSDSRAPNGSAGGDLTGSYPNPIVANAAVTLAKMADLADQRMIGNVAGSAGVPMSMTQAMTRTFLGLGGAAYLEVGTSTGTVAAGDDSRFPSADDTGFSVTGGTPDKTLDASGFSGDTLELANFVIAMFNALGARKFPTA